MAGTLVGLDIGAASIRAVETRRRKDGRVISNFGQVPLPQGAVHSGAIRDEKMVTAALRHLWNSTRFRSRRVVLGVTNPQVVVREMAVANLPERELRASLPFQVREALPLPVESALLDFYPLAAPEGGTVRGLLIAAPKDVVLTAVRAVEKAGLHVEQVDLASFALLRAVSRLDDQVEAIVDIGAEATSVVVHAGGEPLIVRTIPRGGAEITAAVASRLGIGLPEAEAAKYRIGLRADLDPHTAEAVRDAARPLINEINSSFTYLNTGDRPHARVTRVALSGGGALLPGLIEELSDQLGVPVLLSDPVVRVRSPKRGRHDNLERYRSSAAVSIGLALGAAR